MTYSDVYIDTYGGAMSRFGVDYSFSRPTIAELKVAGVTFCCRYVGTPSSGKNLTRGEADALRAAGIDVVSNYEGNSAGWMMGGRTAGISAAKASESNCRDLGMPAGRPVYFSADYNATFDQYKTQIRPCLEGAASIIGTGRVGIYGGIEQVDWAYRDGVAPWIWQTYAWSYGQWSKHSHIQQYRNGQKLGSGLVDYDHAMVTDFGQWDAQGDDMPLTDEDVQKVANAVLAKLSGEAFMGKRWDPNSPGALTFTELLGKYEGTSLYKQLDAILAGMGAIGAVGTLSPQQLVDLGNAIANALAVKGVSYNLTGTLEPKVP